MSELRFPIFIDIKDKKITVIGGGRIAARRIKSLLKFAPIITVISPEISDSVRELSENGSICWKQRDYNYGELTDEFMVLATTSDKAVNSKVVKEAHERHIMVNNASDRAENDFFFPALEIKDDISVGICGTGKNHVRVAKTAEKIRRALSENSN